VTIFDANSSTKVKDDLSSVRPPRICMLTTRGFALHTFRCGFYEAQDVLIDIDDVDLIYLKPKKGYEFIERFQEKIIWHDMTRKFVDTNLMFEPIKLTRDYDLFIVYLPVFFPDIMYLTGIQGWKEHCKTSLCWVNELWAKSVQKPKFAKAWMPALKQFDHIAVGLHGTVKPLSEELNRQCHFVQTGIDAIRFSPSSTPETRVIDIYSMGRGLPELHQVFLEIAEQHQLFYLYDTFTSASVPVKNYQQHRDMFANLAKRTRYFIVAPAKVDSPKQTVDQVEIGARYFEAAAAGAILLGQAPKCKHFDELFNWPDAVIEIQPDGSDVAQVLASLEAQPERLSEISRRNRIESLLRHDWLYRWKQILNIAGLAPTPRLGIRENKLQTMARSQ
jgi:hypothetical protein